MVNVGTRMKFTYQQAMELYPIVRRLPENVILLNMIAEAIMKEKLGK